MARGCGIPGLGSASWTLPSSPLGLTGEEVSLEALLGDRVVGLELNPHVVVLGGDDLGFLGSAELAVELGVRGQAAAHLHVIIFTHLGEGNT